MEIWVLIAGDSKGVLQDFRFANAEKLQNPKSRKNKIAHAGSRQQAFPPKFSQIIGDWVMVFTCIA